MLPPDLDLEKKLCVEIWPLSSCPHGPNCPENYALKPTNWDYGFCFANAYSEVPILCPELGTRQLQMPFLTVELAVLNFSLNHPHKFMMRLGLRVSPDSDS